MEPNWSQIEERYRLFLEQSKSRPHKECIPIPNDLRSRVEDELNRITVRITDRIPEYEN